MKNTLGDLSIHLFSQMERICDEDLTGKELEQEIKRSKAVEGIAKQIIGNARLVLDAEKFQYRESTTPIRALQIEKRSSEH